MKKTLVVAAICLPPSLIGPAIMMGNLLRYFPKESYYILMGHLDHIWCIKDTTSQLNCRYFFTRYPFLGYRGNIFRCIKLILRDIFALCKVFWNGLNIIKEEKIDNIFVVADHFVDLPALLMSWVTGKKMVLWLPDIYYRPDKTDWTKAATRIIEPFILRAVDTVFVTSVATQKYYEEKYNLKTEVLPHSTEIASYNTVKKQTNLIKNTIKILYTGSVVKYNYDVILDMARVVTEYPELNAEFVIITNNIDNVKELCKYPKVKCRSAKRDEISELQKTADILFLPLSFKEHEAILRTASPSKLPEYLASGCPILVYAPASSYYSQYSQEEDFGLVVSSPDYKLLADAVKRLKYDSKLYKRLVDNGLNTVMKNHNAEKISENLQERLGIC